MKFNRINLILIILLIGLIPNSLAYIKDTHTSCELDGKYAICNYDSSKTYLKDMDGVWKNWTDVINIIDDNGDMKFSYKNQNIIIKSYYKINEKKINTSHAVKEFKNKNDKNNNKNKNNDKKNSELISLIDSTTLINFSTSITKNSNSYYYLHHLNNINETEDIVKNITEFGYNLPDECSYTESSMSISCSFNDGVGVNIDLSQAYYEQNITSTLDKDDSKIIKLTGDDLSLIDPTTTITEGRTLIKNDYMASQEINLVSFSANSGHIHDDWGYPLNAEMGININQSSLNAVSIQSAVLFVYSYTHTYCVNGELELYYHTNIQTPANYVAIPTGTRIDLSNGVCGSGVLFNFTEKANDETITGDDAYSLSIRRGTFQDNNFMVYTTEYTATTKDPYVIITYINDTTSPTFTSFTNSGTNRSPNITIITDEASDCRWAESDLNYTLMNWTLSGDGTANHSFILNSSLIVNSNNTYFVACNDTYGNLNSNITNLNGWYYLNNNIPVTSSLMVLPAGAQLDDNLTFSNTTIDPDGDTITDWSIIWYNGTNQVSALNNQTMVNSSYTAFDENWSVSILAFDTYNWGVYYNSTPANIGDNVSPILSGAKLSANSGVNDAPFTIYVNITEINSLSSVIVTVVDTNLISVNYSMSLVNKTDSVSLYKKVYTPGTDGVYNITYFYATDGNSNSATPLLGNLTYTESTYTAPAPTSGGGGGSATVKKECSLDYSVKELSIVGLQTKTIIITNNDDVSFTPNPVIPSELIGKIVFSIPTSIIFSGQKGELNFININPDLTGEGNIIITSDNCNDISIPITVRPTIFKSSKGFTEFFNVELFDLWGLSITNGVISALSLLTALSITLPNKKYTNRTKFLLIILIPLFVTFIFNFIFS